MAIGRMVVAVAAAAVSAAASAPVTRSPGAGMHGPAVAPSNASLYLRNEQWVLVPGVVDPKAVAYGLYSPWQLSPSGFGTLTIVTNSAFNVTAQAVAAGYVEGALTWDVIKQHYDNMHAWLVSNFDNGTIPAVYQAFFVEQDQWARAQVASNTSTFWQGMGAILSQFDGLVAGYNAAAPSSATLSVWALQQLNAVGDFLDLIPALQPGSPAARPWRWEELTAKELMDHVRRTTHCSGLFKVTGNYSDLFFGHSAWFTYEGTNRLFKSYKFGFTTPGLVGLEMSFSSYPGVLSSLDDYYVVHSTGLAMVETSNSIFNMSLYKLVRPQSLFAWQRVRAANLLAVDGNSWGATLASYNSGTYNNAYGVAMLPLFVPGKPLVAGTLTLAEQIPGLVVWGDVTQNLVLGFHPMFNVPYWPSIYEQSGYPAVIAKHGLEAVAGLNFQMAPRAQIFRRDQATVVDLDSFAALMRYNDYTVDPYSGGSPWNAICSRGDLAGSPDGCYDTKVSSATLMLQQRTSLVINGPTTSHGLPPFAWTAFPNAPHEGLPPVYDFAFQAVAPQW